MMSLRMLLLVTLLLGASLQLTHAGEGRGGWLRKVLWDRRDGGIEIIAATPTIYALGTVHLFLQKGEAGGS